MLNKAVQISGFVVQRWSTIWHVTAKSEISAFRLFSTAIHIVEVQVQVELHLKQPDRYGASFLPWIVSTDY